MFCISVSNKIFYKNMILLLKKTGGQICPDIVHWSSVNKRKKKKVSYKQFFTREKVVWRCTTVIDFIHWTVWIYFLWFPDIKELYRFALWFNSINLPGKLPVCCFWSVNFGPVVWEIRSKCAPAVAASHSGEAHPRVVADGTPHTVRSTGTPQMTSDSQSTSRPGPHPPAMSEGPSPPKPGSVPGSTDSWAGRCPPPYHAWSRPLMSRRTAGTTCGHWQRVTVRSLSHRHVLGRISKLPKKCLGFPNIPIVLILAECNEWKLVWPIACMQCT